MNFDLPVLRSLTIQSPQKEPKFDFTDSENHSDTIDPKYLPPVPHSPRLLGGRAIERLDGGRKTAHHRTRMNPPGPQNQEDIIVVNDEVYKIQQLLGSGGSSQVYQAVDARNKVFAIKKVSTLDKDPQMVRVFQCEIELLCSLRDIDRVVRLHNYQTTYDSIIIVMERGESDLNQIFKKEHLSNEDIRFFTTEILKCVEAVHSRNIVHSDLKPANFITAKGVVKLIDFGIAAPIPEFTCNVYKNEQIGTISYMAPEAFHEHTGAIGFKVGKPSDLWSCGCIIYEMIYGRPPFYKYGRAQMQAIMDTSTVVDYPSLGKNKFKVPKHMIELVQGLLRPQIQERFTSERALTLLYSDYVLIDYAFAMDLVKYTSSLGRHYNRAPSEKRLDKITEEVFSQLQKLTTGTSTHK